MAGVIPAYNVFFPTILQHISVIIVNIRNTYLRFQFVTKIIKNLSILHMDDSKEATFYPYSRLLPTNYLDSHFSDDVYMLIWSTTPEYYHNYLSSIKRSLKMSEPDLRKFTPWPKNSTCLFTGGLSPMFAKIKLQRHVPNRRNHGFCRNN